MIKTISRILFILLLAFGLGLSLYLAVHYVAQPALAIVSPDGGRENPKGAELRQDTLPFENPLNDIRFTFNLIGFIEGVFRIGKNILYFIVMTIIVVGIQKVFFRRSPKSAL